MVSSSVGVALDAEGIAFEQLTGSCSLQQRGKCLTAMKYQPDV
jgi:hypothetical protein